MTGKVTVSRVVVFLEEDEWNWMEDKACRTTICKTVACNTCKADEVVDGLEDTMDDLPSRH